MSKSLGTGTVSPTDIFANGYDIINALGSTHSFTWTVPDDEPGTKYCVAVGVRHADSHALPGQSLTTANGANTYSLDNASPYWRISGSTCVTIAKKPNFTVWSGSVYTAGNITTSVSRKAVGAGLSNTYQNPTNIFGSWTEYMLTAEGTVKGMGSGSGLGYAGNTMGLPGRGNTTNCCDVTPLSIANQ